MYFRSVYSSLFSFLCLSFFLILSFSFPLALSFVPLLASGDAVPVSLMHDETWHVHRPRSICASLLELLVTVSLVCRYLSQRNLFDRRESLSFTQLVKPDADTPIENCCANASDYSILYLTHTTCRIFITVNFICAISIPLRCPFSIFSWEIFFQTKQASQTKRNFGW